MYKNASNFMKKTGIYTKSTPANNRKGITVCLDCNNPQLIDNAESCAICKGKILKVNGEDFFGMPKYALINAIFKNIKIMSDRKNYTFEIYPKYEWTIATLRNGYPKLIQIIFTHIPTKKLIKKTILNKEFKSWSTTSGKISRQLCEEIRKVECSIPRENKL